MSKALNISLSHITSVHSDDGFSAISYDYSIGKKRGHKVIVKTTEKLKSNMKTKIIQYCQSRQSRKK